MKAGRQIQAVVALAVAIVIVNCEICRPFNKTTLNRVCGYNYTAKFTHEQHYHGARRAVEIFTTRLPTNHYKLYNCSAYADLIICSLYLPKCVEGKNKPVLPCREVCEEFIQGCKDRLMNSRLEWVIGMCTVLPKRFSNGKTKGNKEECFLPTNFKRTTKEYTTPECFPLIIPACSGLGYKYTILSKKTQNAYRLYMNRTITDYSRKNHTNPTCVDKMRKLICAESVPPCFDRSLHYNCREECENIHKNCSKHFWYGADMCIEFPRGNKAKGYCPQNEWPRSANWPDLKPPTTLATSEPKKRTDSPVGSKSPTRRASSPNEIRETGSKAGGSSGTLNKNPTAAAASRATSVSTGTVAGIAVAVLVILAIVAVVALFMYRRHRASTTGYKKHAQYEYEDDAVQFEL